MIQRPSVYIVGVGAIGKALAVSLQHENRTVTLIRGSVDNMHEKKERITLRKQNGNTITEEIAITTFSNLPEINGILVITIKTFANINLAKKLKKKQGNFSIVLMQNGINIEDSYKHFPDLYRCVIFSSSQITEKYVSFKPVDDSPIGRIRAKSTHLKDIVSTLHTSLFRFRAEINIDRIIWEKVAINCAFNSICPLLDVDMGIFHRNKQAYKLAETVINECANLAKAYKIPVEEQIVLNKFLDASKQANGHSISTMQDIKFKRKTEIDSLNLEVARLAMKINKPELVKHTQLLGEIISVRSNLHFSTNNGKN